MTIERKKIVIGHMIRGTRVKYPRSKWGWLRDKGYRITRLSRDSNSRGRLLGCLTLKEIMILTRGDSVILKGGRINDLGNICWFQLVSGLVATIGFNMTINLTIITTKILPTIALTTSTTLFAMRWVLDKGKGTRKRGGDRGMTKNMQSREVQ